MFRSYRDRKKTYASISTEGSDSSVTSVMYQREQSFNSNFLLKLSPKGQLEAITYTYFSCEDLTVSTLNVLLNFGDSSRLVKLSGVFGHAHLSVEILIEEELALKLKESSSNLAQGIGRRDRTDTRINQAFLKNLSECFFSYYRSLLSEKEPVKNVAKKVPILLESIIKEFDRHIASIEACFAPPAAPAVLAAGAAFGSSSS